MIRFTSLVATLATAAMPARSRWRKANPSCS